MCDTFLFHWTCIWVYCHVDVNLMPDPISFGGDDTFCMNNLTLQYRLVINNIFNLTLSHHMFALIPYWVWPQPTVGISVGAYNYNSASLFYWRGTSISGNAKKDYSDSWKALVQFPIYLYYLLSRARIKVYSNVIMSSTTATCENHPKPNLYCVFQNNIPPSKKYRANIRCNSEIIIFTKANTALPLINCKLLSHFEKFGKGQKFYLYNNFTEVSAILFE